MGLGLMSRVANAFITFGRTIGRQFGYELAVVASDHSLNARMVNPKDTKARAWDPNLYRHGNLFIEGYANPIKPTIDYNADLEDPSQAELKQSATATDGGMPAAEGQDGNGEVPEAHTDVISSPRYREYMRQDLISQVLNPQEQWKKLLYAIMAVGGVAALSLVASASAAGFI